MKFDVASPLKILGWACLAGGGGTIGVTGAQVGLRLATAKFEGWHAERLWDRAHTTYQRLTRSGER